MTKHAKKQTKATGARASGKWSGKVATRAMRKDAAPRGTRTRDPRLPAPGTTITRRYKGRELRVEVLDAGFRFEGETFRSLTAAALRATGYKAISGPHFWKTAARPATRSAARKETATA